MRLRIPKQVLELAVLAADSDWFESGWVRGSLLGEAPVVPHLHYVFTDNDLSVHSEGARARDQAEAPVKGNP